MKINRSFLSFLATLLFIAGLALALAWILPVKLLAIQLAAVALMFASGGIETYLFLTRPKTSELATADLLGLVHELSGTSLGAQAPRIRLHAFTIDIGIGEIYSLLDQLRDRGLLKSQDSTRCGKQVTLWELTPLGRLTLGVDATPTAKNQ